MLRGNHFQLYLFIPTIVSFQVFFWQLSSLRIFLNLFFIVLDSFIDAIHIPDNVPI